MHRRQLIVLYLALSIAALLFTWRLVFEWKRANLRYSALGRPNRQAAAFVVTSSSPQSPAPPVGDIVARNLFSPDRNNDVVQDQSAASPPPPVPIVFGTMNLNGSYEALMAEGGHTGRPAFRRIKNGERMGEYKVVEISDEKVVVEFRGQRTTVNVYQSANSVERVGARSAAAATPVPRSVENPFPPQPALQPAPAAPAPPSVSAQPAPDTGLRVTIEGNRRRVERQTIFGPQVWYEDIQK